MDDVVTIGVGGMSDSFLLVSRLAAISFTSRESAAASWVLNSLRLLRVFIAP